MHIYTMYSTTIELNIFHIYMTGVIIHSGFFGEKKAYIFRDFRQLPHDSNLTINCLLRVLSANKDKLGRMLFLQLDNCYRENKNRYILTFSSLLVDLQIFDEVNYLLIFLFLFHNLYVNHIMTPVIVWWNFNHYYIHVECVLNRNIVVWRSIYRGK